MMVIPGLEPWAQEALGAGVGLAIGALVGLERGFKLRDQKAGTRVAGVRTFSLIGLGAGLAGIIAARQPIAAGTVVIAILGYLAIAYAPRLQAKGDATSPVAAAVTVAAAFLAGLGSVGLALAAAAVLVFILALKDDIHEFVDRLDQKDIRALARFGIIALAVLPFLPDRAMGPYDAWNPSMLWWVVILVTGFSFAGYVANRMFGERHGTVATALIGGAYSSTAVTQSLAQPSLGDGGGAEPAGIALAARSCTFADRAGSDPRQPHGGAVRHGHRAGAGRSLCRGVVALPQGRDGQVGGTAGNPIALLPALGSSLSSRSRRSSRAGRRPVWREGIAILLFRWGRWTSMPHRHRRRASPEPSGRSSPPSPSADGRREHGGQDRRHFGLRQGQGAGAPSRSSPAPWSLPYPSGGLDATR